MGRRRNMLLLPALILLLSPSTVYSDFATNCTTNRTGEAFSINENVICGNENNITGKNNTVWGNQNVVKGDYNAVIGNSNTAEGSALHIDGNQNKVKGRDSINELIGNSNEIETSNSRAYGNHNKITGDNNTLCGRSITIVSGAGNRYYGSLVKDGGNSTVKLDTTSDSFCKRKGSGTNLIRSSLVLNTVIFLLYLKD